MALNLRVVVDRVLDKVLGPEKSVSEILLEGAGVPLEFTRRYMEVSEESKALEIRKEIAKNHHLTLEQQSLLEEARGMVQQVL